MVISTTFVPSSYVRSGMISLSPVYYGLKFAGFAGYEWTNLSYYNKAYAHDIFFSDPGVDSLYYNSRDVAFPHPFIVYIFFYMGKTHGSLRRLYTPKVLTVYLCYCKVLIFVLRDFYSCFSAIQE